MTSDKEATEALTVVVRHSVEFCRFQCCLTCIQWNLERDICDKFNVKPPAKVIMFSCGKDWNADIPF